ncbi:MAG: RNA methyltransferase [Thaumarchaeota archaeon]|nr:RNA methyltransferase [Nitrososphaerota archaeon]
MERSFFVLSGEHEELARDELVSIARSYDGGASHTADSRLSIISSKAPWRAVARRAAFVRIAGRLAGTMDGISDVELPRAGSFAVRVVNLSSRRLDVPGLESETGAILSRKTGLRVSLSSPSLTVYQIVTDGAAFLGYSEGYSPARPRKVTRHPTEIGWKIARCMVNLAGLREGCSLCDPFCGSGTILLEAESMGMMATGVDFDYRMCRITGRNLAANGYGAGIINSTHRILAGIGGAFDAVVTDVPYGNASRSSSSPGEVIRDLVSVIPERMRLVVVYKKGTEADVLAKAKKYEVYRHKSLTRVIAVR